MIGNHFCTKQLICSLNNNSESGKTRKKKGRTRLERKVQITFEFCMGNDDCRYPVKDFSSLHRNVMVTGFISHRSKL